MREVEVRAPDRPDRIRPTLRGLKITDISLLTFRSSIQVFSDKDYKPSPASSVLLGLTGDGKERAHLSKGVGDLVPGAVVYLYVWFHLTFHARVGWEDGWQGGWVRSNMD